MGRVRELKDEEVNYRFHEELSWYPGVIVDVQDRDFGYGDSVVFVIELDDAPTGDDGNPRREWAIASDNMTSQSKLTRWTKGIFGDDVFQTQGFVDLDLAVDERVEVMYEYGQKEDGTLNERIVQIRAARS